MPQWLIPTLGSNKSYQSTAVVNIHLSFIPKSMRTKIISSWLITSWPSSTPWRLAWNTSRNVVRRLHIRNCINCTSEAHLNKDLTSPKERQEVPESHIFLKEKRDQTVKVRVGHGRQYTASQHWQVGCHIANSRIGICSTYSCHWRPWATWCGIHRHTQRICPNLPWKRQRQSYHASTWQTCLNHGKSGTQNLHQVCHHQ